MLTVAVGLDNHTQGHRCGQEAAREALSAIQKDGRVSLALLFTSHPDPMAVLKGVNDTLGDIPLIGAVTAGEYSHKGYVEGGAGVMLIQSDSLQFHPLAYRQHWFKRGRKLLGKLQGITSEGLRSAYIHRALVLFPDNQSMNLDSVVEQAMTETAMLYDILGGAGLVSAQQPAVFYQRRMLQAGLSGVEVLAQKPFGMALANGWTPANGPYRVTQSDNHRVITLDGRPSREVYEDFALERENTLDLSTDFLLQHPIGICEAGECKVSVAMGFDNKGALKVTAPPPTGSLIHILAAQPEAMVFAAERAIKEAMQPLKSSPVGGALFIDCMSTALVLKDAHHQQRQVVQQMLGEVPFLGIRSHGVLARLKGQTSGCYECSVAACLLPG